MKPRALVRCRCCEGSGQVELDTPHQVTLDVLTKSWQTVEEIRNRLGGENSMQSIYGRLTKLHLLDIIEKRYAKDVSGRHGLGSGDTTQWRLK